MNTIFVSLSAALALVLFPLVLPSTAVAKGSRAAPGAFASGASRQFTLQSGLTDGTPLAITIVASSPEEGSAQSAMAAALARAQRFDAEIAPLEKKLAELPPGQQIEFSRDAFGMILKAVTIADQTGGWYDPAAPSPASWFLQRDWRRIVLDPDAMTLRFRSSRMRLDLRAISRGYIADLALDEIVRAGFSNAMIEVGPVRWIAGRDLFTPWNIQIGFGGQESAFAHRSYTYNLTNVAAATVTADGLAQGLTDPKSKKPVADRKMRSITTLASDATTAVAYGLAAYTLGPRMGMRFVEEHPEVKGVIVDEGGNLTASRGLGGATAGAAASETAIAAPDAGPNDLKLKQREEERDQ